MVSDTLVQRNDDSRMMNEAPIAAYERLLKEEQGLPSSQFSRPNRMHSQNSHSTNKQTSYN